MASYGEHGVVGFVGEERDDRLRALRATRPHTVGYIGGCDEEKGEIESPTHVTGIVCPESSASRKPPVAVWGVGLGV